MSGWSLGIDFGTSYTVAVIAENGTIRPVDTEANGRDRMPSSVFYTESNEVLVGTAAQHQAKFSPERYEATPKRVVPDGEVFLGDDLVAVEDLIGAVLRRVHTEACRQQGQRAPEIVRLTHPADWAQSRRAVLLEAAARGGLPEPELVPEPVAAAVRIALQITPANRHIAVYDFGGGTFDAAVLLRTDTGFEVAGPPSGRDPLGGEDIDQRIIGHLGELLSGAHPEEWSRLLDPPDAEWRGMATELRSEVQRAKETLSDVKAAQLWIPGIRRDVQLTRDELNDLIEPDIDATVDALETALQEASVTANDLAGLYLVGGSSRIPLVADKLWRRVGVRPAVQDNPKAVVAAGAASWLTGAPPPPPPPPPPAPATASAPTRGSADHHEHEGTEGPGAPSTAGASTFHPRLAARDEIETWPRGCEYSAQVVIDRPFGEPLTIRLRDEPADRLDTAGLARSALERRRSFTRGFIDQGTTAVPMFDVPDGLERRFTMTVGDGPMEMLERYIVLGGRMLVVFAPEAGRDIADSTNLVDQDDRERLLCVTRLAIDAPPDWTCSEELRLTDESGEQTLTATRALLAPDVSGRDWQRDMLDRLHRITGVKIVDSTRATLLGIPGQLVTATWKRSGTAMITRLGVGVAGGVGVALSIALPHRDQKRFSALARSVSLLPQE